LSSCVAAGVPPQTSRCGKAAGAADQTGATHSVSNDDLTPSHARCSPAGPRDAFTNTLQEYLRRTLARASAAILAFLCAVFTLGAKAIAGAQPLAPPLFQLPEAHASAAPAGLMILLMQYPGLARLGSQRPGLASGRAVGPPERPRVLSVRSG
jgi:hypothetical protein